MVMHRPPPPLSAVLAAWLLLGLPTHFTFAATPETMGHARALLEKGEAASAVKYLEDALAATPSEHQAALIELLRRAYATAANQAQARGLPQDALLYRDNLAILDRNHPAPRRSVAVD